jgi:cell wall assembly regulator SMI1
MKNKQLSLTSALLLVVSFAFAQQDYAFKVLVNKGKNEVKSGDSWMPIKTGTSLKPTDEIKVQENAYVGLIHSTGKPLEVKEAGKHKVVDLAAKVNGGSSVLNKYTDFILSSNTQKKNNLTATGAVHRGGENIKIDLPKPEMSVVYNNKIIFGWETDKTAAPYTVVFSSMFGDELKKIETSGNTVEIDLSEPAFANEDNIRIKVYSKNGQLKESGDDYGLKRLSKADVNRIRTELNEVKGSVTEETALNKLVLAGFYEKNNLLIDAITAYQEAIKLAPDVPEYKTQYIDFLERNGIKEVTGK